MVARLSPLRIGLRTRWTAITAGGKHTIALKSDGTLWAWGWNGFGQLGDGTTTSKYSPVQIGAENKWIAIDARVQ